MNLKTSSAKRRQFCIDLNELTSSRERLKRKVLCCVLIGIAHRMRSHLWQKPAERSPISPVILTQENTYTTEQSHRSLSAALGGARDDQTACTDTPSLATSRLPLSQSSSGRCWCRLCLIEADWRIYASVLNCPSSVQIMACRLAGAKPSSQCWNIVDWTFGDTRQWNLYRN